MVETDYARKFSSSAEKNKNASASTGQCCPHWRDFDSCLITGGPAVKPETKTDKVKKSAAEPVKYDQKGVDGLLDVLPGNEIYARIPGIIFEEEEKKEEEIVKIPDEAIQEGDSSKDESEGEGLFGFSAKTTEILAKGSILLLILFIFILYKTRSRGSSRRVLNRYPKK